MQNGVYKLKHKHLNEVYYQLRAHNGTLKVHEYESGKFEKDVDEAWVKLHTEIIGKIGRRAKFYDLVWMRDGKVKQKLLENKSYALCKFTKNLKQSNYRTGLLTIIETGTKLPV